ncbi:YitT family protein [Bacillus tianshenii]|nr:YitT family protein [Bacillus tianshenii]
MVSVLTRYGILGVGAVIQGCAMALFLFPHAISSGGAAGLSIILHHLFHVPYAVTLWLLNAVMLFAAVKWLGKGNALRTIYCVSVTAFVVNELSMEKPLGHIAIDLSLGAVVFGIGIGILFRGGASSGGMDILALIISKVKGTRPGRTLFWINTTILIATGLIVDLRVIGYALACQWVSTRIIDFIDKMQHPFSKPLQERAGRSA